MRSTETSRKRGDIVKGTQSPQDIRSALEKYSERLAVLIKSESKYSLSRIFRVGAHDDRVVKAAIDIYINEQCVEPGELIVSIFKRLSASNTSKHTLNVKHLMGIFNNAYSTQRGQLAVKLKTRLDQPETDVPNIDGFDLNIFEPKSLKQLIVDMKEVIDKRQAINNNNNTNTELPNWTPSGLSLNGS